MTHELMDNAAVADGLTQVVAGVLGTPAQVLAVQEDAPVEQGASGGEVRAYNLSVECPDGTPQVIKIISKKASMRERQVLHLLSTQRQAIPLTWVEDPARDGPGLIIQEYAFDYPWSDASDVLTEQTAEALAAIHAANLGAPHPWLPRADASFADELFLRATQEEWERNLADRAFAEEFDRYTEPLHAALDRLLAVLGELTQEHQTLTLINTDITPEHLRLARDTPCIIDWDQAHYGSLYLDLPNVFSVETALCYRDALARHGVEIPPAAFLERYREVGRYMGLRYLEVGLLNWHDRSAGWPHQRWFLYYCLTLALRGR